MRYLIVLYGYSSTTQSHELPQGKQTADEAPIKILTCLEEYDKTWQIVEIKSSFREKVRSANRIVSAAAMIALPALHWFPTPNQCSAVQYCTDTQLYTIWHLPGFFFFCIHISRAWKIKKYQGCNKQLGDGESTYPAPLNLNNLITDPKTKRKIKLMRACNINISQNSKIHPFLSLRSVKTLTPKPSSPYLA